MAAISFKWLIFIIILSSILPAFYFFKLYNPPAGYVFAGRHIDDGQNIGVMTSYIWDYNDPFVIPNNVSVFNNPIPGPPYILVTLGVLSAVLGIDPLVFIFLLIFIFTIAYLVLIYFIIGYFSKTKMEQNIAFLLFSVATGIGGVFYIILNNFSILPPERLIHLVIGSPLFTSRIIYLLISISTGYTFFILLLKGSGKKNIILMTVMLGLTILFYPFFGIIFFITGGLFCIIKKKHPIVLFPSLAFFIPWIVTYIQSNLYNQYRIVANADYYNFYAFIINGGFTILFSCIAIFYFIQDKSNHKDKNYIFVIMWSLLLVFFTFIPNPIIPKTRFAYFVWVPLSILAAKGIILFRNKTQKTPKILISVILILSLPTIVIGFAILYNHESFYITQDEFDAMKTLKQYPPGNVISSMGIGSFIPYYSEKMSLRGEREESQEILSDYTLFFSNGTIPEKESILEKYNITYVYFSNYERSVSNGSFDPGGLDIQKIYNNSEVSIYRNQP